MSNPRRANGAKRDRVVRRVKREESTCHLCSQPVDVHLPHGLDASPEVDELHAVGLGGDPFARANCRLAHRQRWCNNQRSNKPYLPERARLTADPPVFGPDGMLVRAGGRSPSRQLEAVTSRDW